MAHELDGFQLSRRHVVQRLTAVLGSVSAFSVFSGLSADSVFGQGRELHDQVHLKNPTVDGKLMFLNPAQLETVAAISDLIIPRTKTAGARDTKVHLFIDLLLSSLAIREQKIFLAGLTWIDRRSQDLFKTVFARSLAEQQIELLSLVSCQDSQEMVEGIEFFDLIKSLVVFGHYTSREGLEQELGYQAMGYGVYQGCNHPQHGV